MFSDSLPKLAHFAVVLGPSISQPTRIAWVSPASGPAPSSWSSPNLAPNQVLDCVDFEGSGKPFGTNSRFSVLDKAGYVS